MIGCMARNGVFLGRSHKVDRDASKKADDGGFETVESVLVDRALEGDLLAFQELVTRYQRRVYAVAFGIMGNAHDAEDIVQEGFLKAFRNLPSFRRQSSFYTWLYRIIYNLSLDEKRRRYRHVESSVGETSALDASATRTVDGGELLGRVANPDVAYDRGELRSQIARAIESLSAEHRAVILLREVEGLSYAEISDVVDCSKGTVMSRLHHARRRLQKILVDWEVVETRGERSGDAEDRINERE